ncbi:MAG: hypothetical protein ABIP75_03485 [Pyrinomonadaceae bacterium]
MKNVILICMSILLIPIAAFAQGTGFSFQGRLNDGSAPANGPYDLQFRLYDSVVGGGQIGSLLARPNTILINGVFSVTLDFGLTAFNNPNNIFIEISLRPTGSPNAYTILGPRQQLTIVPIALRAMNATNADNAANAANAANAQNAVNATNAATATNALSLGGVAASGYARINTLNTGTLATTGDLFIVGGGTISGAVNLGTANITGNATQSGASNGLVKAMVYVDRNGTILRCYNGFNTAPGVNCGLIVTLPITGVYRIDFGVQVAFRFMSITPEYGTTCNVEPIACRNAGANFRFFGSNSVEVFTFDADNREDTSPAAFMLVMY